MNYMEFKEHFSILSDTRQQGKIMNMPMFKGFMACKFMVFLFRSITLSHNKQLTDDRFDDHFQCFLIPS